LTLHVSEGARVQGARARRSRFYLALTVLLLLMVFVGFARTFYLRPFFEQPSGWQLDRLPWVYLFHGTVATAWFALLVVQSALVHSRKIGIHRKLGFAMAGLAVLVVTTGVLAVLDSTPRRVGMGLLDPGNLGEMRAQSVPLFLDLLSLVVFTAAVGTAMVFRTRVILHRTLILVGSMAFMVVTLVRILGLIPGIPGSLFLPLVVVFFLVSPIALLIHDWVTLRRFPAYAFAGLAALLLMAGLTFVIPSTEWGFRLFLRYLSGGYGSALL
jgi:hypothetical protein